MAPRPTTIRLRFAASDSKAFNNNVPLRGCSLLLTPAETDAFRNPYLGEKSFRADFAETLRANGLVVGSTVRLPSGWMMRAMVFRRVRMIWSISGWFWG